MIFRLICILFLVFHTFSIAQNTDDVGFLKDLHYMKGFEGIDCDNTSGSNLEHRICLNIQLRKVDSIMLAKYNNIINSINNDSIKTVFKTHQKNWEYERKSISLIKCGGLESNVEAIIYMHSMMELTKLRIKAFDYIIEKD